MSDDFSAYWRNPRTLTLGHIDLGEPRPPTHNPKDVVGQAKAPLHYLPAPVLMEVGLGMMEGGLKYGAHNWRKAGVRSSIYYDATLRHLMAWWEGEDIDPDSNLHHVTKAIASLMVLRDAMMQDRVVDDRPIKAQEFVAGANRCAAELSDKYPNPKSPNTERKIL